MAETRSGIVLFVEDATKRGFDLAKKGATSFSNALKGMGRAGAAGFKAIGAAVVVFNQGLELGRKAVEVFRNTVGLAVEKALEFRNENDAQVRQIRELQEQFELLAARIGDVFIPILAGVADSLIPAIERLREFVNENRELIATGATEFIARFATGLVKGLAFAANLSVKGINEVRKSIVRLQQASTFFNAILAQLAGSDEDVDRLANEYRLLGLQIDGVNDNTKALEDAILEFQFTAEGAITRLADNVRDRAGASIEGTTRKTAELAAANEKAAQDVIDAWTATFERLERIRAQDVARATATIDRISNLRKAQVDNEADLVEAQIRLQDQQYSALAASIQGVANQAASAFGAALNQIIFAGESAQDVLRNLGVQLANLATSAALRLILQFAVGGAGGALGGAFAGGLFAFAGGGMVGRDGTPIQRFASGGMVAGGVIGRDSTLVATEPGEVILNAAQQRNVADRLASPGTVVIQTTIDAAIPPNRASAERYLRDSYFPAIRSFENRAGLRERTVRRTGRGPSQ